MKSILLFICICAFIIDVNPHRISFESFNNFYNMFPLKVKNLEVSVKAQSDAIIVLTTEPYYAEVFYVIYLGGWNNTRSRIQKGLLTPDPENDYVGPIFKGDQFQTFTVAMDDIEGSISVKKGVGETFLYYEDPYYTKMTYFGLTTPEVGQWNVDFKMFDCDCCYQE